MKTWQILVKKTVGDKKTSRYKTQRIKRKTEFHTLCQRADWYDLWCLSRVSRSGSSCDLCYAKCHHHISFSSLCLNTKWVFLITWSRPPLYLVFKKIFSSATIWPNVTTLIIGVSSLKKYARWLPWLKIKRGKT